jgi:hypothetical protein
LPDSGDLVARHLAYVPGRGRRANFGGKRGDARENKPVIRQKLLGFLSGGQTEQPGIKPRFRIVGCSLPRELGGELTGPLQALWIDFGRWSM